MKILYTTQELDPFVTESPFSTTVKHLAQFNHGMPENEVRVFMPRYGSINERKHQLHEVIRLSGINVVVDKINHELLVKVASLAKSKIQVYFISNDYFFADKHLLRDETGRYPGNTEDKAIFFAKSILETLQRLVWVPDVVHVHNWFSALILLYLRTELKESAFFKSAKLVYSVYPSDFDSAYTPTLDKKMAEGRLKSLHFRNINKDAFDLQEIHRLAIEQADAVIFVEDSPPALKAWAQEKKKVILEHSYDQVTEVDAMRDLYGQLYQSLHKKKKRTPKQKEESHENKL